MPSSPNPLNMKELCRRGKAGYNTLRKLMREHDIDLSTSSIRLLLTEGRVPKKTTAEALEEFFISAFPQEFASMGLSSPAQLWDDYTAPTMPLPVKGKAAKPQPKSDYELLLQKLLEAPTMLRPEVLDHYSLTRNQDPFTPDVKEIFRSTWHKYGVEMLSAAADMGSMIVISGESGSGKSTVVADFISKAGRNVQVISPDTDASHLRDIDILQACVYEMSEENPKRGMEALTRQVKRLLKERAANNIKVILIINNAHDIKLDVIRYIKRLWEIDGGFQRLMGVALVGQNELEARLFDSSKSIQVREFTKRATHVRLGTMNEQTRTYVEHRIKAAGGKVATIIDNDALDLLAAALCAKDSKGKVISVAYPLAINELMSELMEAAYDYGEKHITAQTLKSCGYPVDSGKGATVRAVK